MPPQPASAIDPTHAPAGTVSDEGLEEVAESAAIPASANDVDRVGPRKPLIPRTQSAFDSSYWDAIRRLGGRPRSFATGMKLLRDGQEAWQARLQLIAQAKSSILVSSYHINPDRYGLQMLDALIAKARQNPPVKVLVKTDGQPQEFVSSEQSSDDQNLFLQKIRQLEEAGGAFVRYGRADDFMKKLGAGDHMKALVVDGTTAITGGRNVGAEYIESWRDLDAQFSGSTAQQVGKAILANVQRGSVLSMKDYDEAEEERAMHRFRAAHHQIAIDLSRAAGAFDTAQRSPGASPRPGVPFHLVSWDPMHAPEGASNPVTRALVETFDRARKEIILSSNYVNGVPELRQALLRAAQRGVSVTLITGGENANFRTSLPRYNAERHYPELIAAGVKVRETRQAMEHGKMYVVDGEVAAFGSYNIEHPADDRLAEMLMFTDDRHTADTIRRYLLDDVENFTDEYQPKELSFWEEIVMFFKRLIAAIIEPFA